MFAFLALASCIKIATHEEKSFLSWMRESNSLYTGDEYHFRLGIYLSNSRLVQEHNKAGSFKLALNKFAAMTSAEYKSLLGHRSHIVDVRAQIENVEAPASKDWRDENVVNAIKDQGQCGSCWAFGTVQACESAYAIKNKKLYSCSEQNLVDCVTTCYGCNGGIEKYAVEYIINHQNGLLMSEKDYPYKARTSTCQFDASKGINKITSYEYMTSGKEDDLKNLVGNKGVVDIGIDASHFSFQLYSGGIYNEPSCSKTSLDHAVGCVGYGTEGSTDYWIVRNSWGTSWGEKGYIRMIRNKNNQCGVATEVVLPKA